MRKLLLALSLLLLGTTAAQAQTSVTGRIAEQPAAPATCVLGDYYSNTTTGLLFYCSATNVWSQVSSGGGGSPTFTNLGNISAPPTFTVSGTGPQFFKATLTASIGSSTLTGATAGQQLTFELCEDGTGGRNFGKPSNLITNLAANMMKTLVANACTVTTYRYDGTNAIQVGEGVVIAGCQVLGGIVYASKCPGADAGAQINNAILAGGTMIYGDYGGAQNISTAVFIPRGVTVTLFPVVYTQSAGITVDSGARLLGMGAGPSGVASTSLIAANAANIDQITINNSGGACTPGQTTNYVHWWELAWINVRGNSANQTSGRGVVICGLGEATSWHDMTVQDTKNDACYMTGPGAATSSFDNIACNISTSGTGYAWNFDQTLGNWHAGVIGTSGGCTTAGCIHIKPGAPGGMTLHVGSWKSDDNVFVGPLMFVEGVNFLAMDVGMWTASCTGCTDLIKYTTAGSYGPPIIDVRSMNVSGFTNLFNDPGGQVVIPLTKIDTNGYGIQGPVQIDLQGVSSHATSTSMFRGVKVLTSGQNDNVLRTFYAGSGNDAAGLLTIVGPSAPFSISGFLSSNGGNALPFTSDGTQFQLINNSGQPLTLLNENTSSRLFNRIVTQTGTDVPLGTGNSAAYFIYHSNDQNIATAPTGAVENAGATQATFTITLFGGTQHGFQVGQVVAIFGVANACFNTGPGTAGSAILSVTSATFVVANTTCTANTTSGGGTASYDRWMLANTQPAPSSVVGLPSIRTTNLIGEYLMADGSTTRFTDSSAARNTGPFNGGGCTVPPTALGAPTFGYSFLAASTQCGSLPTAINAAKTIQMVVKQLSGDQLAAGSAFIIGSGSANFNGIEAQLNNVAGNQYPSVRAWANGGANVQNSPTVVEGTFIVTIVYDGVGVDHIYFSAHGKTIEPQYLGRSSATPVQSGAGGQVYNIGGRAVAGNYWGTFTAYSALFYSDALTLQQVTDNAIALEGYLQSRGVILNTDSTLVTQAAVDCIGDSITEGPISDGTTSYCGNGSNVMVLPSNQGTWTTINHGVASAWAQTCAQEYPFSVQSNIIPTASPRVHTIFLGTNDIYSNGQSGIQAWNWVQRCALQIKRSDPGSKVGIATMLSRGNDVERDVFNTRMRQGYSGVADFLIDLAESVLGGSDSGNGDACFTSIHPKQGCQYNMMTPIFQRSIASQFGNLNFTSATTYASGAPAGTLGTAESEATNTMTFTSTLNPGVGSTVVCTGATPAGYNSPTNGWFVLTSSGSAFTAYNDTTGLAAGSVHATCSVPQEKDVDVYAILNNTGSHTLESCVGRSWPIVRKNINGASVTITPWGSETINGAASYLLTTGNTVTLYPVLISASAAGCNWSVAAPPASVAMLNVAETFTALQTLSSNYNVNVTPVTVNANVSTDQNLMAYTVPAGTLNSVGRTLKIYVAGVYSTPAASTTTVTLKVKLCTVSGCGSGTVLTPINITSAALGAIQATNDPFNLLAASTTQTAGASSAYEAHGNLTIDISALSTAAEGIFADNNTATVGTIDSTAQLFLQVTVTFSAASGSNSATQRQMVVEIVN